MTEKPISAAYKFCPECEEDYLATRTHVQDNETGMEFCGAICHYNYFGGRADPITIAEAEALKRAEAWHAHHNIPWTARAERYAQEQARKSA